MSFYHRYELVKLVRNGEPKSFQAREIQSGRNVLLHLWSMTEQGRQSPVLARLRDQMRDDPAILLGLVVEVQEHADPPYAVTVFEEGFPGLELWLDGQLLVGQAAAPPAPAPAQPKPEEPATPPGGGFAGLFGGEMGTKHDPLSQTTRMEIPAQPRAAQPPPAAGPITPITPLTGKVLPKIEDPEAPTRMLDEPTLREWQNLPTARVVTSAPITPPPAPQPPSHYTPSIHFDAPEPPPLPPVAAPKVEPPPPLVAQPPAPQEPGEFTRMFQTKAPEPLPPPVSQQPVPQQPGEFTQMFQAKAPAPPPPPPVALPKVEPPPPPPIVSAEPGEFTRMFQGGTPVPPPPAAVPAPTPPVIQQAGEFTRIFQAGSTALTPPAAVPGTVPLPPAPAGPSEFTRSQPPAPVPEPPPAAPSGVPEPQQAGEFTRLFTVKAATPPPEHAVRINVAARNPTVVPPPPAAVPPSPPAGLPAGHSEFTRLFGNPVAPPVSGPPLSAPPPTPVPPPPSGGEGEFTKFFASPLGANPLPVEQLERGVYQPPAPPPSDKPFRGPSDFTIRFGGGFNAGQENVPPPPAHAPGSPAATGLFAVPQSAPMMPSAQAQQPSGPSEFTRVLQGPHFQQSGDLPSGGQTPQGPGSVSVPAPGGVVLPPPPKQNKWVGILVGVLTCVVIVLVIAVVILAFKK
jgi:hypothetical protein